MIDVDVQMNKGGNSVNKNDLIKIDYLRWILNLSEKKGLFKLFRRWLLFCGKISWKKIQQLISILTEILLDKNR